MNGTPERTLANRPTAASQIAMNDFYGRTLGTVYIRPGELAGGLSTQNPSERTGYAATNSSNYYHPEGNGVSTGPMGTINQTTGLISSGTLTMVQVVRYNDVLGNPDFHLEIGTTRSTNGGFNLVNFQDFAQTQSVTFARTGAVYFGNFGFPTINTLYKWIWASTAAGSTSTGAHTASGSLSSYTILYNIFITAFQNSTEIIVNFS
jgi:hypothetical protein